MVLSQSLHIPVAVSNWVLSNPPLIRFDFLNFRASSKWVGISTTCLITSFVPTMHFPFSSFHPHLLSVLSNREYPWSPFDINRWVWSLASKKDRKSFVCFCQNLSATHWSFIAQHVMPDCYLKTQPIHFFHHFFTSPFSDKGQFHIIVSNSALSSPNVPFRHAHELKDNVKECGCFQKSFFLSINTLFEANWDNCEATKPG